MSLFSIKLMNVRSHFCVALLDAKFLNTVLVYRVLSLCSEERVFDKYYFLVCHTWITDSYNEKKIVFFENVQSVNIVRR